MASSSSYHNDTNCYDHASGLVKIEKIFDSKGRKLNILDLGCGDGRLSKELVKHGHAITGIDSNEQALQNAKKNGLRVLNADIEKELPLETASFDAVLLLDVLEHLYDQEKILKEIYRVLKENGSLYIAYPNHFDLRNRLNMLFGGGIVHWDHKRYKNAKAWSYGHIRFLLLRELTRLLATKGFYPNKIQFNFMSGGIIPTKLSPKKFRIWLLKTFPQAFTGKYIIEATKTKQENVKKIYIPKTIKGI